MGHCQLQPGLGLEAKVLTGGSAGHKGRRDMVSAVGDMCELRKGVHGCMPCRRTKNSECNDDLRGKNAMVVCGLPGFSVLRNLPCRIPAASL